MAENGRGGDASSAIPPASQSNLPQDRRDRIHPGHRAQQCPPRSPLTAATRIPRRHQLMNTNPICNSLIALPRQVNVPHVTTPFRKTKKNRNITSTFKLAKDAHLRRQRDLLGELQRAKPLLAHTLILRFLPCSPIGGPTSAVQSAPKISLAKTSFLCGDAS